MTYDRLAEHIDEIQRLAVQIATEDERVHAATADRHGSFEHTHVDQTPGIKRYFASIPELFEPFRALPDPELFTPMIDPMEDAARALCTGADFSDPLGNIFVANRDIEQHDDIRSALEDWTGSAALEFRARFLDPFPSVVQNQFGVAYALMGTLIANRELWTAARRDVDDIAHKTIAALEQLDGCSNSEWQFGFSVLSSTLAILGSVLPVAGLVAVGVIAAAAAATGTLAPDDSPQTEYTAATPQDVIDALRDGLQRLTRKIIDAEDRIARSLEHIHTRMSIDWNDFVAPRPALADISPTQLTGAAGLGYAH